MISSYDKLTIGKYLEIKKIIESDYDDIDKNVQLICILGDYDEETVLDLPLSGFNRLLQGTAFLASTPKPNPVSHRYKLGKMELEITNLEKMTTAQFIDYQTFIKDENKIVELLSVLLIPKGCKYNDGYDIMDVQKLIKENLSILDCLGLSAFFLQLYQALLKSTVTYSIKKLKKVMKKEKDMEKRMMMEKAIRNLELSGVL